MAVFGGGPTATGIVRWNSPTLAPLAGNQSGQSPSAFVAQPASPAATITLTTPSGSRSNSNATISGTPALAMAIAQNFSGTPTLASATASATGKAQFEIVCGTFNSSAGFVIGIDDGSTTLGPSSSAIPGNPGNTGVSLVMGSWGWVIKKGGADVQSSFSASGLVANDVLTCEFDTTATTISFYRNGTQVGTTITGLGTIGSTAWAVVGDDSNDANLTANFAGPFTHTLSSGYSAYDAGTVSITGTVDITDAADTISASGATTITGTLATTDSIDTLSATGADTVSGTFARTDTADTTAAAASSTITGTTATTDTKDTTSSTGTLTVTGTAAMTDALDTLAASGTVGSTAVTGTASLTDAVDTMSGSGTVLSISTGNIKVWMGTGWTPKPVKVWNGSSWIAKPVNRWNGSAWAKTNY